MLAFDGLVGLALLVLWLYCIFDAITTDESLVRNLPKGFWILLVIMLPDVGSVLWLVAGRPRGQQRPGGARSWGDTGQPEFGGSTPVPSRRGRSRPMAPDDDPEFLASLDRSALNQWEADLRRREEELRRREGEGGPDPASSG